jgi:prepilin-type N-terminal cleavage/methylation domain-containing protein
MKKTPASVSCAMHSINKSGRVLGFTLVELLVVVSIVAVLAGMLFKRVMFYQEMAEKAAMQQVVNALQNALVMEYGHRMARNMNSAIDNLSNENPIEWLGTKPVNYVGEVANLSSKPVTPGSWVYVRSTRELVYVLDHHEYFVSQSLSGKNPVIRFKTRFTYERSIGAQGYKSRQRSNVTFSIVEPYEWKVRE